MNVGALLVAISSFYGGAKALQQALADDNVDGLEGPKGRRARLPGQGAKPPYTDQPMVSKTYTVKNIGQRLGYIIQMVQKGRDNPEVRRRTVQLLSQKCGKKWCTPEKNWSAEVKTIFDGVRDNIRYTRDTYNKDLFQHPLRTFEFGGGDCIPEGTLLLVEGHRLVPIENILVGSRIWGLDDWTTVQAVWPKGVLPVDNIELNNGSSFKATADHKVYVALCGKHPIRYDDGKSCSCPISERSIERLRVGQLEEGMVLLQPSKIPFGTEEMDLGRAYIEGLYLSDGWINHDGDFSISGQDGCPKEEQKREVEAICKRLGIPTTWQRKSINVQDKEWTTQLKEMGAHAPDKHALSINLTEDAAREILRGIMADSGANASCGRTFTSTSRLLTIQTRLLHRMFGKSCGERFIVDHGGLGQNPIWRLQIRDRQDGKAEKLLRVRTIDRQITELPVWDLTTEDHKVYLPEVDVTISQCDDYAIVLASMLQSVGYPVRLRVIQTVDSSDWNHIYNMVGLPPQNPTKWMPLDASVDRPAGWQAPRGIIAAMKDFEVP